VERGDQSTGEFLAIKFPHVPLNWLRKINQRLGELKQKNITQTEFTVQWRFEQGHWVDRWIDWLTREYS